MADRAALSDGGKFFKLAPGWPYFAEELRFEQFGAIADSVRIWMVLPMTRRRRERPSKTGARAVNIDRWRRAIAEQGWMILQD